MRTSSTESEESVISRFNKGDTDNKISLKHNNDFTADFINGCPEKVVINYGKDEKYNNSFDVSHLTYGFELDDSVQ